MTVSKPTSPLLDIENVLSILKKISIFGGIEERQLHKLFRSLKQAEYSRGEVIFTRGEAPSHIYIIKKGQVELLFEGRKYMSERILFDIGQCFGETSVIGIQPHTATAVTVDDCELIVLSREALMRLFSDDKELFGLLILNIAREMSRRLREANEMMLNYRPLSSSTPD